MPYSGVKSTHSATAEVLPEASASSISPLRSTMMVTLVSDVFPNIARFLPNPRELLRLNKIVLANFSTVDLMWMEARYRLARGVNDCLGGAVRRGHVKVVEKLLSKLTLKQKYQSLAGAAKAGNIEVVRLLIEAGADAHTPAGIRKMTQWPGPGNMMTVENLLRRPFLKPSQMGYTVVTLLDAGAHIDPHHDGPLEQVINAMVTDFSPWYLDSSDPAAHANARKRIFLTRLPIIRLLLERGANVRAYGRFALEKAAENGLVGVVEMLLEYGADIHGEDDSALRLAATAGCGNVVALLLKKGADVSWFGEEALHLATEKGHLEVMRLLLDAGVDPNSKRGTALQNCCIRGDYEGVWMLLNAGAIADSLALVAAAANNRQRIVRTLLQVGAKPDGYINALHVAAGMGHSHHLVDLCAKASRTVQKEALWVARRMGHEDIVQYLEGEVGALPDDYKPEKRDLDWWANEILRGVHVGQLGRF
ncbi:hypothetical protein HDV00_010035 [Rhizophlyctis rosea]|nr:hypothetical protein HDV00_010035 [Rhizophlyctis rosea]